MVLPYRYPLRATLLGVVLAVFILLFCFGVLDSDQLHAATLYTGRASAVLFLPVFVARPLADLFGQARFGKLLRQRAGFGLVLAGNHHVHMILLTIYIIGEGAGIRDFTGNPALYIYFLLVLMNITSFNFARPHFSLDTINGIHIVGLYALAIAFFATLVLTVLTGEEGGAFRFVYTGLFFIAILIRIAAKFRKRDVKGL